MPINSESHTRARRAAWTRTMRRAIAAGAAAFIGFSLPVGLSVAGADVARTSSSEVIHFFSKSESQTFSTAAGLQFAPSRSNPPKPGDLIEGTDLDYVGNQSAHAKSWTASDHELCILNSAGTPVCHGQVAIGGSMILAQATLADLSASTATTKYTITGGTGAFQGASGTIVAVNVTSADNSNSDVTITLVHS
jgi:hypothetical protein